MGRWQEGLVAEIALIDPEGFSDTLRRRRGRKKLFPALGLGYVAASLERNGDRVRVLDTGVANRREVQRFLSKPTMLFGITVVSYTFREALRVAQAVKNRYPATPVILGGPHVAIDPESCLQDGAVDYALRGEGEEALIDFVEVLKRNPAPTPQVLAGISGLVYREEGRIRVNPVGERLRNLDELPYPAWHLFPMRRYRQHPLLTSRGCPMDCSFCAVRTVWGPQWIHRSPDQVVAEMAWMQKHWGRKVFHINDDNLTMSRAHIEAFCDAIRKRRLGCNWVAQGVRADAVDAAVLARMRRAGCHRISLGIESADPDVLRAVGKQETVEDMARAVRLCRAAGIQVLGMFMVGNPGDNAATVEKSIAFAREQRIDLPAFYMAIPYPRTRLWEYVQAEGSFLNPDYLSFTHHSSEPVFETPAFPAEARRRVYAKAQKFCRRCYWTYHLTFWWPPNLLHRNGFEIRSEMKLLWKAAVWPLKFLTRRMARRAV